MKSLSGYLYIFATIALSVYGQVILKWRMNTLGTMPEAFIKKFFFLFKAIFDPYIFSSFLAAFIASMAWMAALTKFELSFAYPFMSSSFILVLICSYLFLNEGINVYKIAGICLIALGLIVASRSI